MNMKKILVIDDNDFTRILMQDVLQLVAPQAEVIEAADGREGISAAQASQPDIILLDGRMPHMNGDAVAETLRQLPETQQIPLVAVTSEHPDSLLAQNLRKFCDVFMPKPVNIDTLRNLLQTYGFSPSQSRILLGYSAD